MPVIDKFGGLIPRESEHLLPENAASVAHNVKLRNGRLEPWQEKLSVSIGVEDALSIYAWDCCYHSWATCVNATEYLPDHNRLYLTGRGPVPEVAVRRGCALEYFNLGLPTPGNILTISGAESYGETSDSRSYIYTYINQFGEESGPSAPTLSITVADGSTVTVSGFTPPSANYGAIGYALYRSATGTRTGAEQDQEPLTDYVLVAELPLTATSYSDSVLMRNLGPALETKEVRLPPADLRQIQHVNSTGMLVGVTNNQVHFSEDLEPWNWPAYEDWTLPSNIVNMRTLDTWVFVSTDGKPIVVDGTPHCEPGVERQLIDCDVSLPDIGCGYPNSATITPFGMVYASVDGLVLLKSNAQADIITSQWFGTEEWRKLRPETVRLAYWRGYLVCVTDRISFMLEIDGGMYGDYQLGALSTISDKPVDMQVTSNGELLMLEERIVYQWNASHIQRPYTWVSSELDFTGKASPTAAKVKTLGIVNFELIDPQNNRASHTVTDSKPFRLPRMGRHLWYKTGFSGVAVVEYMRLGTAISTLTQGV